jgi:hypothetical protein
MTFFHVRSKETADADERHVERNSFRLGSALKSDLCPGTRHSAVQPQDPTSIRMAPELKDLPEEITTAASLGGAMQRIEEAQAALDRLPDNDEAQDLTGDIRDGWDRPLRYEPVGDAHYELRSAGPDGQFGTLDDKTLDNLNPLPDIGKPPQIELND